MKKYPQLLSTLFITLCAISLSSSAIAAPYAGAAKKTAKSKAAKPEATTAVEHEAEPDISNASNVEYKCELGNSVVMYAHENDDQNVALRWKNRVYKLSRVATTTGAQRFENEKSGLVWIDIPAKGMLLDSHHGHQLANECKTTKMAMLSDKETGANTTQVK
jgi:membrane-bound inhibitor of C-type lysozyme